MDTFATDPQAGRRRQVMGSVIRLVVILVLMLAVAFGYLAYVGHRHTEVRRAGAREVHVMAVVNDTLDGTATVVLHEATHNVFLPIGIGQSEALAIEYELYGKKPPRPLTSDLMKTVLESMKARVTEIEITEVIDRTFYAKLFIQKEGAGEPFVIDARPSDAIALALRFGSPMFVGETVLDRYGVSGDDFDRDAPAKSRRVILEFLPGNCVLTMA